MGAVHDDTRTLAARPLQELVAARSAEPRGARPAALHQAAAEMRARLVAAGAVRAVRTVDVGTATMPVRAAFGGAARAVGPDVAVIDRLVAVQYDDLDGALRTLVWGVRDPHVAAIALDRAGLSPEAVDVIGVADLQELDVRVLTGGGQRPTPFPRAQLAVQRREADAAALPHPTQREAYANARLDGADPERIALVDEDVELGAGVSLISTPGRSDGHQSLCLVTSSGVWVISSNGVSADNWQPHLSRIPGVRRWAEAHGGEVVPAAGVPADSITQHDSMVVEKVLADAHANDPRWLSVLPTRQLLRTRRSWPIAPTFVAAGADEGAYSATKTDLSSR